MKIYTRKGDGGLTALATGEQVPKHDDRVDLYGTVDELNSVMGMAVAFLRESQQREGNQTAASDHIWLIEDLRAHQSILMELGAELAGSLRRSGMPAGTEDDVLRMEQSIDRMSESLKPLKNFILPGGTPAASGLHVARTVCRRLERGMSRMHLTQPGMVQAGALKYINRLSDYLFTAARYANVLGETDDIVWQDRQKA